MDRKYRKKIEKSLEIAEKSVFEDEEDKNIMKSAEKLASLLPNNVNKAKIISQLYAGKALDVLIGLIEDETVPPEVRSILKSKILSYIHRPFTGRNTAFNIRIGFER